jgi:hypothetical protein
LAKQKQPPKGKTIPLIYEKAAFGSWLLAKFKIKFKSKTKTLPRITRIGEKRPLALSYWLLAKFKIKIKTHTADYADKRGFAQIFGSCIFDVFRLKFAIGRVDC